MFLIKGLLRIILSLFVFLGVDHLFRMINKHKITILIYHGVVPEALVPPCSLQLSVQDFAWQMAYMKRHYHVMPLSELVRKINQNEVLPDNIAVVTFDDGFENNYTVAYPVLKRLGIPATIFIPTGFVETDKILWPQELYLMMTASSQKGLDMRDHGMGIYDLRTMSSNTNMMTLNTQVIDDMRSCFKNFPEEDKKRLLAIIRQRLGVGDLDEGLRRRFAMLSWEQITKMNQSGFISFGSHTANHPFLINLDKDALTREIVESFETIKKKLNSQDILFAYTYGNQGDFNELSKQIVKEQGAVCAVTTIEGLNGREDDLFELKRVFCNVTRDAFRLAVSGCLTELKKLKRSAY